jgi:alpha-1,6-mannosyltransferase
MADRSAAALSPGRLRLGPAPSPARLRIADVTLFYGERSGGIRTYLEAKAAFAARSGAFEHHLVIPHDRRSLQIVASNGYRLPLGGAGLAAKLRALRADIVLLHDPYWTPRLATRAAHEAGAVVIAVHHSSAALHAAGLPGPDGVYAKALQRWYRRAYRDVDAVMTVVDPMMELGRTPCLPLRLGLDPAFRPQRDVPRGDHVLYVGRLSREKGLRELLEAAASATGDWALVLLGTGPAGDTLRERARQLGLSDRIEFAPYLEDRKELARAYAAARCVVLPGAHETFGLAALEAAACGTPVVTARSTPSAGLLRGLVETFDAGDPVDLASAIERARGRHPDPAAAAALAAHHGWDRAIRAELADLHHLLDAG